VVAFFQVLANHAVEVLIFASLPVSWLILMEAAICSGLNCFSSCFSNSFQTCADIRGAFLHPSERTPDIFNTDQGSQFSSVEFIKVLVDWENKISMDGKGAWRYNVFVERLWRTIKYEEGYLCLF